jgi:uncharacterized protein
MPAVSNSSPLIFLAAIDRINLLRTIYGEIMVPPAVWREAVIRGAGRPGARETRDASWIRVIAPSEHDLAQVIPAGLDAGETEAIALAISIRPTGTVILDDLPARRVALKAGLDVTGTGGVLVLAKQLGLITSVGTVLSELREVGLYLSEAVIETFLSLADER